MTTTKEKERAKEKESKETTKEKEKDITKEKDATKDGTHGVTEDTTITAVKDKEEEKEERRMLLHSATYARSSDMRQPTAGTRILPTLQQLLAQVLLVRHNTTAWIIQPMTNQ